MSILFFRIGRNFQIFRIGHVTQLSSEISFDKRVSSFRVMQRNGNVFTGDLIDQGEGGVDKDKDEDEDSEYRHEENVIADPFETAAQRKAYQHLSDALETHTEVIWGAPAEYESTDIYLTIMEETLEAWLRGLIHSGDEDITVFVNTQRRARRLANICKRVALSLEDAKMAVTQHNDERITYERDGHPHSILFIPWTQKKWTRGMSADLFITIVHEDQLKEKEYRLFVAEMLLPVVEIKEISTVWYLMRSRKVNDPVLSRVVSNDLRLIFPEIPSIDPTLPPEIRGIAQTVLPCTPLTLPDAKESKTKKAKKAKK